MLIDIGRNGAQSLLINGAVARVLCSHCVTRKVNNLRSNQKRERLNLILFVSRWLFAFIFVILDIIAQNLIAGENLIDFKPRTVLLALDFFKERLVNGNNVKACAGLGVRNSVDISARNGEKAVDLAKIDVLVPHQVMNRGMGEEELIGIVGMEAGGEKGSVRSVKVTEAEMAACEEVKMHCGGVGKIRDCVKERINFFVIHFHHVQSLGNLCFRLD